MQQTLEELIKQIKEIVSIDEAEPIREQISKLLNKKYGKGSEPIIIPHDEEGFEGHGVVHGVSYEWEESRSDGITVLDWMATPEGIRYELFEDEWEKHQQFVYEVGKAEEEDE